jgi:hypothetical protein
MCLITQYTDRIDPGPSRIYTAGTRATYRVQFWVQNGMLARCGDNTFTTDGLRFVLYLRGGGPQGGPKCVDTQLPIGWSFSK